MMKKVLLLLGLFCFSLNLFSQNYSTWDLLCSTTTYWQPAGGDQTSAVFTFSPIEGEDYADATVEIKNSKLNVTMTGDVWVNESNDVMMKVKGKTDNGIKVMMYGELRLQPDGYIEYEGNLSVELGGQGQEMPVSYELVPIVE